MCQKLLSGDNSNSKYFILVVVLYANLKFTCISLCSLYIHRFNEANTYCLFTSERIVIFMVGTLQLWDTESKKKKYPENHIVGLCSFIDMCPVVLDQVCTHCSGSFGPLLYTDRQSFRFQGCRWATLISPPFQDFHWFRSGDWPM